MTDNNTGALVELTADVVSAYVANNPVPAGELPALVNDVHAALSKLDGPSEAAEEKPVPAVSVKKSVKPDAITCLECGKSYKSLRRHLKTAHGLEVHEYRAKYDLPASYPVTAPSYSKERSELAVKLGLGRKAAPEPAAKAQRPRRKPKAAKAA